MSQPSAVPVHTKHGMNSLFKTHPYGTSQLPPPKKETPNSASKSAILCQISQGPGLCNSSGKPVNQRRVSNRAPFLPCCLLRKQQGSTSSSNSETNHTQTRRDRSAMFPASRKEPMTTSLKSSDPRIACSIDPLENSLVTTSNSNFTRRLRVPHKSTHLDPQQSASVGTNRPRMYIHRRRYISTSLVHPHN